MSNEPDGEAGGVSLVMPAFDAAGTIDHALGSVLRQTMRTFEIVVVDDGSADDTVERVTRVGDERVRVLRQDHRGAAAARNTGVAATTGELVAFVDSDDMLLPGYLESMTAALRAAPADVGFVHTDAFVMHADTHRVRRFTAMERYRPSRPPLTADELYAELLRRNFIYNAVVVRRSVLAAAGPFDESLTATIDYDMWLRIAALGYSAREVPGPLALYRWGRSGSISSNRARVLSNTLRVLHGHEERATGSPLLAEALSTRIQLVTAELAAVEGANAPRARLRRARDRVASITYPARSPMMWYRRPPAELVAIFPDELGA